MIEKNTLENASVNLWVGSTNPVKINACGNMLSQLLNDTAMSTQGINVPSGVADQPMTEAETRLGAVNRVNALLDKSLTQPEDWCMAIEGGVDHFKDGPATFAYVAIAHKGYWSIGRSASLPLPDSFYAHLQAGAELGPVMDEAFGTINVKQKGGAIGLLTENHATRQSVYEVALTLALSKFRFPELYFA